MPVRFSSFLFFYSFSVFSFFVCCFFFFFNDTATTEIYTLSLHDALPIFQGYCARLNRGLGNRATCSVLALAGRASAVRYLPLAPRWLAVETHDPARRQTPLHRRLRPQGP